MFARRCRRGQVQEQVTNIEKGDWRRHKVGLKRTELRVRQYRFTLSSDRVNPKSGEEHCWRDLAEGSSFEEREKKTNQGKSR